MSGEPAALRPLFVAADEGSIKARAAGTGGALGGHPLHVHHHEHEAFYVLTGTVDFFCGDEQFRARAGSFVFLPRGVPHTFLGISEEPSRVLVLLVPGGLEEAFADPARFDELLEEHDVEVVGPSPA
jgi:mannose-6-phosphate isomerase-like protein (cupin superfamily)